MDFNIEDSAYIKVLCEDAIYDFLNNNLNSSSKVDLKRLDENILDDSLVIVISNDFNKLNRFKGKSIIYISSNKYFDTNQIVLPDFNRDTILNALNPLIMVLAKENTLVNICDHDIFNILYSKSLHYIKSTNIKYDLSCFGDDLIVILESDKLKLDIRYRNNQNIIYGIIEKKDLEYINIYY